MNDWDHVLEFFVVSEMRGALIHSRVVEWLRYQPSHPVSDFIPEVSECNAITLLCLHLVGITIGYNHAFISLHPHVVTSLRTRTGFVHTEC